MINAQRLSTVLEVAKTLAAHQDLEEMLAATLSCVVGTLDVVDGGVLLLCGPRENQLSVSASQGYEPRMLEQISLAPGEAMCTTTFQTGKAALHPTPEAIVAARAGLTPANRELFDAAIVGPARPQSAVCLPLIADDTRVGTMVLENRCRPGAFVPEDLPFLEALASLIALSARSIRLRKELQATKALEEANRLKAELISMLAHELRTPLTSIKGYSTALLMEEATFGPETQREFLQVIDEECDILQGLIHDLLESSIIDAGLLRLEPQPVRLPRLTGEVIDDMSHRTSKHMFLVDFPDRFPIVDADPHRIAQVLRNLLDNAIKYSPDGGLIVVRGDIAEDEVVLSVADQGVGLAPEHLNRLFEKFFRAESALGRHVVGSGLGLPISRTIVESHRGRIWAESELGQGSTFYFTLPLTGPSLEPAEGEENGDG